jgi:hypothetical protein
MRVIIQHPDSECPDVKLEEATKCPGHWIEVVDSTEDMLASVIREATIARLDSLRLWVVSNSHESTVAWNAMLVKIDEEIAALKY